VVLCRLYDRAALILWVCCWSYAGMLQCTACSNHLCVCVRSLGRRASIDFLKGNKELVKEIETEVREIMAKKLTAGGVTSSDDSYDEDEEEGNDGGGEGEDFEFQQS
jgi:hypothetical protein